MRLLPVLSCLLLLGCGGSSAHPPTINNNSTDHNLVFTGALGVPGMAGFSAGVMQVQITVNGTASGVVLVDTGAPETFLNPMIFASTTVPDGSGTVGSITVGATTVDNPPVVGTTALGADFPGLLGSDLICQFAATFNYRDGLFALGDAPPPAGVVATPITVPFQLLGGGYATFPGTVGPIEFPPTRIIVSATIEGVRHTFVVDTGSSFVVLTPELFASITADGRATLAVPVEVPGGVSSQYVTRLHTATMGGAAETDVIAMTLSDDTVGSISLEVGEPVDGLVGAAFLRHYNVVIDYPSNVLKLQQYTDESFILDEFTRVGFELGGGSTGLVVGTVFPGTDAESQGVTAGDAVLAVDGTTLDPTMSDAADRMLRGTPGTVHMVTFSTRTIALTVENLLPLP